MRNIQKIQVSLQFSSEEIEVGELVQSDRKIYFKFYPFFLELNLDISPIKLRKSLEVQASDVDHFEGLFGVFGDSLPDGWGRLLTDRRLISQGIPLHSVNALQRLAFIGKKGRGALNYKPMLFSESNLKTEIHLDELANASLRILEGEPEKKLDVIRNMGGSSGGARPKIQVLYDRKNNIIKPDVYPSKKGFESWIIKFPNSTDFKDAAQIEYAYYLMAQDAGIEIMDSKLFNTVHGNSYFGTQRFDRLENKRLHLISAAGLMHDNYRLSNLDYGHLMDAAFRLEKDVRAYEKIFRMAVFNVITHNRDDHSKNFSYLMDEEGTWRCAPAYDLTFSHSSHGWHSTSVAGESQFPTRIHLLKLANSFQLRDASEIIDQVESVAADWKKYAKESGVKKESQNYIEKILGKSLKK